MQRLTKSPAWCLLLLVISDMVNTENKGSDIHLGSSPGGVSETSSDASFPAEVLSSPVMDYTDTQTQDIDIRDMPHSPSENVESQSDRDDSLGLLFTEERKVEVVRDSEATPIHLEESLAVLNARESHSPSQVGSDAGDVTSEGLIVKEEQAVREIPHIYDSEEETIGTQDVGDLSEQKVVSSPVSSGSEDDSMEVSSEAKDGYHVSNTASESQHSITTSSDNMSEEREINNQSGSVEGDGEPQAGQGVGPVSEEEEIVTFEEFKTKMSAETASKQAPSGGNLISKVKNNYASSECGSKVIAINEEAKNPGAILLDNRDVYMLNPCSAKIWFVVELCELIIVSRIEIGCFELFSSIPEQLTIYASEEYPTNEWQNLGTISMRNERVMQGFALDETGYAKYIKVQQLSHYGSEHYCPISMLRVLGASMMEEYEFSESQREQQRLTQSSTTGPAEGGEVTGRESDEPTTIGPDAEAVLEDDDTEAKGSSILAATGAILSVIGKAVNGFMGPNGEVLEGLEGDIVETHSPQQVQDQFPSVVDHSHIERPEEPSDKVDDLVQLRDGSQPLTIQADIDGKNKQESGSGTHRSVVSLQAEEEFLQTQDVVSDSLPTSASIDTEETEYVHVTELGGASFNSDAEKVIKQTTKEGILLPSALISDGSETGKLDLDTRREWPASVEHGFPASLEPTLLPSAEQALGPSDTQASLSKTPLAFGREGLENVQDTIYPSLESVPSDVAEHLPSSFGSSPSAASSVDDETDQEACNEVMQFKGDSVPTSIPDTPLIHWSDGGIHDGLVRNVGVVNEIVHPTPSSVDATSQDQQTLSAEQSRKHDNVDVLQAESLTGMPKTLDAVGIPAADDIAVSETSVEEEPGFEEPNTISFGTSNITGANQSELLPDENGCNGNGTLSNGTGNGTSGGYSSTREKSVFIRLSNRINYLETNMSLFSSYLEQISLSLKRNKNRTEDMQRMLERRILALNETIQPFEERMLHQNTCNGSRLLELEESICLLELKIAEQEDILESTTRAVAVMSVCGLVLMAMLTLCTTLCLLSQKRGLLRALAEVKGELDKVQETLGSPAKGRHPAGHKWINSNHTIAVAAPREDLVGSFGLDSDSRERQHNSVQLADMTGQIAHQNLLSSSHSCPSLQQQQQLHLPSTDDCSWYSTSGLDELVPAHSPSVTAADGSLISWPQQRSTREEKWQRVQHKRRRKSQGNSVHSNHKTL